MHLIYKAVNVKNGKAYIGCTSRPLNVRISEHKYRAAIGKDNLKLYNAIRKYGFAAFEFSVVAECDDRGEMLELEKNLIREHNTFYSGYNTSTGGESGYTGVRGESHPMFGTRRSWEQKRHQSDVMKGRYEGEANPFYGKSHSNETKNKISVSRKNLNYKPQTTKYWKVVLPCGGVAYTSDRVQFCKDNNLNYNSVRTATRQGRRFKNYKFEESGAI